MVDVKPELAEPSLSNSTYGRVLNPLSFDSWGWDAYWNISHESSEDEIYSTIMRIATVLIPSVDERNQFFVNSGGIFEMPKYYPPDFNEERFLSAPDVKIAPAPKDGVAPEYYHSTSMYPEYFKLNGKWILAEDGFLRRCE